MVIYTPETYSVKYGHKENVTNFTSTTANGTTDIHTKNVPYLVELEGLQPNTTYYYYVLASNSNGSTASITKSFTTPPPSEINVRHFISAFFFVSPCQSFGMLSNFMKSIILK